MAFAMLNITHADASANILWFASKGRLIQGHWQWLDHDGRRVACLLGSMHQRVKSAADCNGELMPLWMAEVTVMLFDRLAYDDLTPIALRYGALIARWDSISADGWNSIMRAFLIRCIDDTLAAARPLNVGKPHWAAVEKTSAECRRLIVENDFSAAASAAAGAAYAAGRATESDDATRGAEAAMRLFTFLLDQIEAALG